MGKINYRIKEIAAERGKTMTDIYFATNVAESTLSRINNGKLSPSLDTLQRIADYLEVSVAELWGEEQQYLVCPHCKKLIKVSFESARMPRKPQHK